MKEDPKIYDNLVKEITYKINRFENRYNFGVEINEIKKDIFTKKTQNQYQLFPKLPKLNISHLENLERSVEKPIALSNRENQKNLSGLKSIKYFRLS